jgi:SnoaL-like protein
VAQWHWGATSAARDVESSVRAVDEPLHAGDARISDMFLAEDGNTPNNKDNKEREMTYDATRDQIADSRAMTGTARIRELMLGNLFTVFNERDPARRSKVIAANYTDDVIWTDPDGTTVGHQALNEQTQKLLDRLPDFVFSAAGPVHISRDLSLLAFNYGVPEQPPAFSGIDVALVRDGRIAVLHTILTTRN